MTMMASQVTSRTVVYSTVYSDADQRKHQSSASLAFVWGIHRDRWMPRTKGQLRGKYFHLMTSSCLIVSSPRTVLQPQSHRISNKSQPERLQKPLLIPIVIICRTLTYFSKQIIFTVRRRFCGFYRLLSGILLLVASVTAVNLKSWYMSPCTFSVKSV